jgi:tRNA threonylcarbamoyladenosine biosynthesis protein TsaE
MDGAETVFSAMSHSLETTIDTGRQIARFLSKGDILCLSGDLGAGKTTLMKGLVAEITQLPAEEITSPTFTYLHTYSDQPALYHFDLYRLKNEQEFMELGFYEFLFQDHLCCIEWPERILPLLPDSVFFLLLEYQGANSRKITMKRKGS